MVEPPTATVQPSTIKFFRVFQFHLAKQEIPSGRRASFIFSLEEEEEKNKKKEKGVGFMAKAAPSKTLCPVVSVLFGIFTIL